MFLNRRKNRDTLEQATVNTAAPKPPTVYETLRRRKLELLEVAKGTQDALDLIEKHLEWLKRYPEVEGIIQSLLEARR